MKFIEIKEILDICYDNIYNLNSIITNIEIKYPKEFREYNEYYDSFLGKEFKKGK